MAFVHGKNTYVSVNGHDISTYCNTSAFTRGGDSHDVTTYGKDDHVFAGGLKNNTMTLGGIYDAVSGGPGGVFRPIVMTVVAVVRRTEGTGSGKPNEAFNALVTSYVETNPVADMISWSAELQVSDAVTLTTQ